MSGFTLRGFPAFPEAVAAAEFSSRRVGLFGASGSGKSSILEAMAGLRPEITGTFEFGGRPLAAFPPAQRSLGIAPQAGGLFPHMRVEAQIMFGVDGADRTGRVAAELARFDLDPLRDRRPSQLSGGEQKLVGLARALARRPSLLLLDEPFAGVDWERRERVLPRLQSWLKDYDGDLLLVSHDPDELRALTDHLVVLHQARVVDQGPTTSTLQRLPSLRAREALGCENLFTVHNASNEDGIVVAETANGLRLCLSAAELPRPGSRLVIAADDILIATERPVGISAQNLLPAVVQSLDQAGEHVWVRTLAHQESVVAKLTPRAVQRLHLEVGSPLHLVIKAHTIRLLALP